MALSYGPNIGGIRESSASRAGNKDKTGCLRRWGPDGLSILSVGRSAML